MRYEELQVFFERAAQYCFCEPAVFCSHELNELTQKLVVPYFLEEQVLASSLERWSLPTDFGKEYRRELLQSDRVTLFAGLTCTELVTNTEGTQVTHLCARAAIGKEIRIQSRQFVVACGGLETTRLLMASRRYVPDGLGNQSGLLGRFYMGHISGRIARIPF